MRAWLKPNAGPASTKARFFNGSVGTRAMRAKGATAVSAMAKKRSTRSGPSRATTISPRMSEGKESSTSITFMVNRLMLPPA